MSFGFSCIDVLSSAKLAVDGKHCAQHVTLGSSKIRWRLLLSDMTIIAKACERVSISLEYVRVFIGGLDLIFQSQCILYL